MLNALITVKVKLLKSGKLAVWSLSWGNNKRWAVLYK
jgi:hypothetical protein